MEKPMFITAPDGTHFEIALSMHHHQILLITVEDTEEFLKECESKENRLILMKSNEKFWTLLRPETKDMIIPIW